MKDQALALRPSQAVQATNEWFIPQDAGRAYDMCKHIATSGLAPASVDTPEKALVILMMGAELGLPPMKALRTIHVINGKPTMSADLMAALVKASPACEYFQLVESTDQQATYTTKRRGEPTPTTMTFSMAQAHRAGLTNSPTWKRYPEAMLRARCITALARAVYPDVCAGLYDPDELGDQVTVSVTEQPIVPQADTTTDMFRRKPAEVVSVTTGMATREQLRSLWKQARVTFETDDEFQDWSTRTCGTSVPTRPDEIEFMGFTAQRCAEITMRLAELATVDDPKPTDKVGALEETEPLATREDLRTLVIRIADHHGWDIGTSVDMIQKWVEGTTGKRLPLKTETNTTVTVADLDLCNRTLDAFEARS